jgi:hypothetical protein
VRVQSRPCVYLLADQGDGPVAVLEGDDPDVLRREPRRIEGPEEENVGVGPQGGGDPLAFEVGDLRDRRPLEGDERGPFGLAVEVNPVDRIPVGAGDERRGARGRPEVHRVAVEEFERPVGALAQEPFDLDAASAQPLDLSTRETGL